jgi:hypothetical protein
LGVRITIEPLHGFFPGQVILFNLRDENLAGAKLPQGTDHVLPQKAATSGYHEPFAANFHGTSQFNSAPTVTDCLIGNRFDQSRIAFEPYAISLS